MLDQRIRRLIVLLGHIALGYAVASIPITIFLNEVGYQMWMAHHQGKLLIVIDRMSLIVPGIGGLIAAVVVYGALLAELWGTFGETAIAVLIEAGLIYIEVISLGIGRI